MKKPLIFISHIHEESEVAIALKDLISKSFLGGVEFFISSDPESIGVGEKWLEKVTEGLNSCSMEIILCSEESIKRPWINFEAGSGWIKNIKVAPVCYANMSPSKLPIPLNLLTAIELKSIPQIKSLFKSISEVSGLDEPQIDFQEFIEKVTNFEEQYIFWDQFNNKFNTLLNIIGKRVRDQTIAQTQKALKEHSGQDPKNMNHSDLEHIAFFLLKNGDEFYVGLSDLEISQINKLMPFMKNHSLLEFKPKIGGLSITPTGSYYGCGFFPTSNLKNVLTDQRLDLEKYLSNYSP